MACPLACLSVATHTRRKMPVDYGSSETSSDCSCCTSMSRTAPSPHPTSRWSSPSWSSPPFSCVVFVCQRDVTQGVIGGTDPGTPSSDVQCWLDTGNGSPRKATAWRLPPRSALVQAVRIGRAAVAEPALLVAVGRTLIQLPQCRPAVITRRRCIAQSLTCFDLRLDLHRDHLL
jgi:hypothetical protein